MMCPIQKWVCSLPSRLHDAVDERVSVAVAIEQPVGWTVAGMGRDEAASNLRRACRVVRRVENQEL